MCGVPWVSTPATVKNEPKSAILSALQHARAAASSAAAGLAKVAAATSDTRFVAPRQISSTCPALAARGVGRSQKYQGSDGVEKSFLEIIANTVEPVEEALSTQF